MSGGIDCGGVRVDLHEYLTRLYEVLSPEELVGYKVFFRGFFSETTLYVASPTYPLGVGLAVYAPWDNRSWTIKAHGIRLTGITKRIVKGVIKLEPEGIDSSN